LFIASAVALAAMALAAPAAQAAKSPAKNSSAPKFLPPKAQYLALGDSLAFGYQQAKFDALKPDPDPAAFNTGYVDDFSVALRQIRRRIKTVNLGCPGETTDSFLGFAPCPYTAGGGRLHQTYRGSQMSAAITALKAKAKRKPTAKGNRSGTSPVTLDIGANDVLAVFNACNTNPAPYADVQSCLNARAPAAFAHVGQNLGLILDNLRRASKRTEIIVLGLYNPLVVLLGPSSDAFAAQLNSIMAAQAAAHRARFADPLSTFNPPGPNELPTICSLTAICTPLRDIHATDTGYQALANLIFTASGYANLGKKKK
jgi:lysophospholipase L1-like esterase